MKPNVLCAKLMPDVLQQEITRKCMAPGVRMPSVSHVGDNRLTVTGQVLFHLGKHVKDVHIPALKRAGGRGFAVQKRGVPLCRSSSAPHDSTTTVGCSVRNQDKYCVEILRTVSPAADLLMSSYGTWSALDSPAKARLR